MSLISEIRQTQTCPGKKSKQRYPDNNEIKELKAQISIVKQKNKQEGRSKAKRINVMKITGKTSH